MNYRNHREGRREFVKRLCVSGASIVCPGKLLWSNLATAHSAESPSPKSYPSHGPGQQFLERSRELIAKTIMPPPKGRRVNDHVFVSSRLENVFFLRFGERAVLIDTGFDHQLDRHLDNFKSLGCELKGVVAILATHSHVDHTGGVKRAQDRLGVPIVAHSHAVQPIGRGDLLQTAAVIPELDGWEFEFPACKIDETVDAGDVIMVGDERIEVVHIPGHTPDSLGYVWRQQFFVGDAVFGGGAIGWANARWFSNYSDHADSMTRLLKAPPDATEFYPAHGVSLPYDAKVPTACLTTLRRLIAEKVDPCNHTARVKLRPPDEPPRVLRF